MKIKKNIFPFVILFILFITGCIIERNENFKVYLQNSSGHDIEIFYFKNGNIDSNKTIILEKTKEVAIDSGIIIRGQIVLNNDSNLVYDSALVLYDKKYSKIHYLFMDSISNSTNVATTSRNIFNFSNYEINVVNKNSVTYIYTFTEQDYLDAQ